MEWWSVVLAVAGGVLLLWLAMLAALAWVSRGQSEKIRILDGLRLVPDVVRLTRRLAADSSIPRGVRIWLGLLLAYLLLPIDLVPDFIPVIGYLDDAIVVAVILRSVTRRAGAEALERHWPGTPQGLAALRAVAGLTSREVREPGQP
ncbi:DUF1232 domain-containing protein [Mycetocola sp. 2940]|uniref:YkvA family protein n=1 Tax=Mycetocola sp. 2940 TaxID=3156452 RepID=UPI00339748D8